MMRLSAGSRLSRNSTARRPNERLSSWACRLASAPDGCAIFVESTRGCFSSKTLKPRAKFTAQGRAEKLIGSPMLHALRSLAVLLILLAGRRRRGGDQALRARGHGERRRAARPRRCASRRRRLALRSRARRRSNCLTEAARAVVGGDFATAEKLAGAAITAAPKDPANWLAYAGIAAAADDAKANDRYEMVTRGRDRGLCRLSAFDDAGRPGRGAC